MKKPFSYPVRVVLCVTSLAYLSLLSACGSDSDESSTGRTMVVEVGDGQPGLRLLEETIEGDGSVSEGEIQQCADVFEGDVQGWKVAGDQNAVELEVTQAFAAKITGNQNSLNLIIKAKEGETGLVSFPGVCLVMAGNQPSVSVTLNGVTVETFKVVANGNKGSLTIKLEGGSELPDGATDDLGKHVTVTVAEEE